MFKILFLFFALSIGNFAFPAQSEQHPLARPFQVELAAGFWPNPFTDEFSLAIHNVDATLEIPGCPGFIGHLPDYRVELTGSAGQIQFSILADQDTALFIEAPDGSFRCVWDAYGTANPSVLVTRPQAGSWTIWIALPQPGILKNGQFSVTEFGR